MSSGSLSPTTAGQNDRNQGVCFGDLPPSLKALVAQRLDESRRLTMALTCKDLGDIVARESDRDSFKHFFRLLDGLIETLKTLIAEQEKKVEPIIEEQNGIEALLQELTEKGAELRDRAALAAWVNDLGGEERAQRDPQPISRSIQKYCATNRYHSSTISKLLKDQREKNAKEIVYLASCNECLEKLESLCTEVESLFSTDGLMRYDAPTQKKNAQESKKKLIEILKAFPLDVFHNLSHAGFSTRFFHLLQGAIGEQSVDHIREIAVREGISVSKVNQFTDWLNRFPEEMTRLNVALLRSEMRHLQGENFTQRKAVWIQNLIDLVPGTQPGVKQALEDIQADTSLVLLNQGDKGPEKVFDAVIASPEALQFISKYALDKIECRMRESSYLSLSSLGVTRYAKAFDSLSKCSSTAISQFSGLIFEDFNEELLEKYPGKYQEIVRKRINYLLAYDLPEKAAQLVGHLASEEERAQLLLRVAHYCLLYGRVEESRSYYLQYLRARTPTGKESIHDEIDMANRMGISLVDLAEIAMDKLRLNNPKHLEQLLSAIMLELLKQNMIQSATALLGSLNTPDDSQIRWEMFSQFANYHFKEGRLRECREMRLKYLQECDKIKAIDVAFEISRGISLVELADIAIQRSPHLTENLGTALCKFIDYALETHQPGVAAEIFENYLLPTSLDEKISASLKIAEYHQKLNEIELSRYFYLQHLRLKPMSPVARLEKSIETALRMGLSLTDLAQVVVEKGGVKKTIWLDRGDQLLIDKLIGEGHFKEAIEIAQQFEDGFQVLVLCSIGKTLYTQGAQDSALEICQKAYHTCRQGRHSAFYQKEFAKVLYANKGLTSLLLDYEGRLHEKWLKSEIEDLALRDMSAPLKGV